MVRWGLVFGLLVAGVAGRSGTTYVADLSVAGVRTSIGITAGGSLVRLA